MNAQLSHRKIPGMLVASLLAALVIYGGVVFLARTAGREERRAFLGNPDPNAEKELHERLVSQSLSEDAKLEKLRAEFAARGVKSGVK